VGKRRDCLQPKVGDLAGLLGPEVPELVTIVVLERMAEDLRDGGKAIVPIAGLPPLGDASGEGLVELGHRLSLSGARAARQA